jgi:hypothetical protein
MRKTYISLFVILSILLFSINVYSDNISVTLNGVKLDFDVPPQIISDRTFVPMRKIFEALGATVSWNDETKTVTGRKNDTVVNLTIGSNILLKNGDSKLLDVAPTIIDSRTLVPIRAIAEAFDCDVQWLAESQIVEITNNEGVYTNINDNYSEKIIEIDSAWLHNNYGTQRLELDVKNNTDEEILRYDIDCLCFDAYGEPVTYISSNVYNGYSQNKISPHSISTTYWDLYGFSGTYRVDFCITKYVTSSGNIVEISDEEKDWYYTLLDN